MEEVKNKQGKIAYKYIERYEDPASGQKKKVSITLDKKTRQAQNAAQRMLNKKIANFYDQYKEKKRLQEKLRSEGIIENDKTLEDMIRAWFEMIQDPRAKKQLKGSTISGYSYGIDMLFRDYMTLEKEMLIQNITHEHIQAFYDRLVFDLGRRKTYVKRFRAIIRGAFTLAYKKRYIKNLDPINLSQIHEPIRSVKDLEDSQVPRYLEKKEAEQIFEILKTYNPLYTQVFELQYHTGMRFGEVMALEEKNLHDGFLLDIHGTYDNANRSRTRHQKVPPKTKKSFRTIELGAPAIKILTDRIYHNQFIQNKKSDYIFVSRRDRPYDRGTLNRFITAHCAEFITSTKVSTHVFRHTHISLLAEKGVPLKVIMDRVGHQDRETTEKIYMHVTKKQKTDLVKTLNEF